MEGWSATQRQYLEAMGYQMLTLGERPSSGALSFSPKLQNHLAKAAKIPYEELAQRVYLPPDLATNPHAKRAFWHVLKGIRQS